MPSYEGKIGEARIDYHPSRLGVLLARLCHSIDTWYFTDDGTQRIRKKDTRVVKLESEYQQDRFLYMLNLEPGSESLERKMEEPFGERIEIIPHESEGRILIERDPMTRGKWRNNNRVRVRKVYEDGSSKYEKRFWMYDLNKMERYVHELLEQ